MNRLIDLVLIFFAGCASACLAQGAPSPAGSMPVATNVNALRQKDDEDEIARLVNQVRKDAGLVPLKRVRPLALELQLICTAAIEKPETFDSFDMMTFEIQSPKDLGKNQQFLDLLTFGSNHDPKVEKASQAWEDKNYPGYSVIVFRGTDKQRAEPRLVVGIARKESKLGHAFGCTFSEDGCSGQPWKKYVAPSCLALKR